MTHSSPPRLQDGTPEANLIPEHWEQIPAYVISLQGDRGSELLLSCYREMLRQSPAERESILGALVAAEYQLDDTGLHAFARARINAWLSLDDATREQAVGEYAAHLNSVEATTALRRAAVDRAVVEDLPDAEQEKLVAVAPSLFNQRVAPQSVEADEAAPTEERDWSVGRRNAAEAEREN